MSHPVIFLDIDGVMIPTYQCLVSRSAFFDRIFPQSTILVLNELCSRVDAKVVINSSHNNQFPDKDVPEIKQALINHGFKQEYFHEDPHTRYPSVKRDVAITEWLNNHPEVSEWVAIDDSRCAPPEHMVLCDPDYGLTLKECNMVLDILGGDFVIVLI